MVRLAGKASRAAAAAGLRPDGRRGLRRFGLFAMSPDFQRLLRYGRAVEITRLIDEVGFQPALHRRTRRSTDYVATQQRPAARPVDAAGGGAAMSTSDRPPRTAAQPPMGSIPGTGRGDAPRELPPRHAPRRGRAAATGPVPLGPAIAFLRDLRGGSKRARRRRWRWPAAAGAAARHPRSASTPPLRRARAGTTARTSGASTRSSPTSVFPLLEFLYDRWWRVEADGRPQRARPRPRAARRQPRRDPALGRDDDGRRDPARAPAAALPALPRPELGVRAAVRLGWRCARSAACRRRRTTRSGCSSRTSSSPSSPRA